MKFGSENRQDTLMYNAVFMVENFNSQTYTVDEQFMTNADTHAFSLRVHSRTPSTLLLETPLQWTGKGVRAAYICL